MRTGSSGTDVVFIAQLVEAGNISIKMIFQELLIIEVWKPIYAKMCLLILTFYVMIVTLFLTFYRISATFYLMIMAFCTTDVVFYIS